MTEEVESIQTEDGQFLRNYFDVKPTASLKAMPLLLRNEISPDITVGLEPLVGSSQEDVVREHVIVAKCGYYGDRKSVAIFAEDFSELIHCPSVGAQHLTFVPRNLLIAVVPRRVSRPYHEVNVILEVLRDPLEGRVYKREGRIAIGGFGAVCTSGSLSTMAGRVLVSRRMNFVERIGMEI
jgi:hypothetical protein